MRQDRGAESDQSAAPDMNSTRVGPVQMRLQGYLRILSDIHTKISQIGSPKIERPITKI